MRPARRGCTGKVEQLIEITDFVDLDQIDPVYFRSTYYLAPRVRPLRRLTHCCARLC